MDLICSTVKLTCSQTPRDEEQADVSVRLQRDVCSDTAKDRKRYPAKSLPYSRFDNQIHYSSSAHIALVYMAENTTVLDCFGSVIGFHSMREQKIPSTDERRFNVEQKSIKKDHCCLSPLLRRNLTNVKSNYFSTQQQEHNNNTKSNHRTILTDS